MKIKNKGKVHPSPSPSSSSTAAAISSSSSSSYSDGNFFDVFNYLPAAILALLTVLTVDDREVLAFMMIRSMETSTPSSTLSENKFSKKVSKKSGAPRASFGRACNHAPPSFSCFDCYMSYWNRWNSSPNGELIHQAIEAFEEQLANGEKSGKNVKSKRKDKIGRRTSEKPVDVAPLSPPPSPEVLPLPIDDGSAAPATSVRGDLEATEGSEELPWTEDETAEAPATVVVVPSPPPSNHKGLARKVWPDVLGLFNSRLWSLWGPN